MAGGASGIGAAVVERLRTAGYHVIILHLNFKVAKATAAADPENTFAAAADVSEAEQVALAIDAAKGRSDTAQLLINCAGIAKSAKLVNMNQKLCN